MLPKEGGIYHNDSKEDVHFYFYTGMNVEIKIFAIADVVNFLFIEGKKKINMSINIPFLEAESFLDIIFKKFQNYHSDQYLNNAKISVDKKDFNYVKNYLKNNDLEHIIQTSPDDYKLKLKNKNRTYELNIKQVLKYNIEKRRINNLDLLRIPMVTKDESQSHAYCEFLIPGWKIQEFKAYSSILYNDLGCSNENQFINKLKKLNPKLGSFYSYQSLSSQLPENISKQKNNKL